MESQQLKSVIESLLFVSSKPLTVKELSRLLEQQAFAVQGALDQLVAERRDLGVVVLENGGEYQLATNSVNSTHVKNFLNAELREKLTDATVEVLAIIAYRQPISKAELEAIRGVNSQYSLRHLLMRGLIEKVPNPHDARGYLYQTTTEFLQHMGLTSTKDLPEFDKLVENIKLPETAPLKTEAGAPAGEDTAPPMAEMQNEIVPNAQETEPPQTEPASVIAGLVRDLPEPTEQTPKATAEQPAVLPAQEPVIPVPEPDLEAASDTKAESEEAEEYDDDDEDDDDDEKDHA